MSVGNRGWCRGSLLLGWRHIGSRRHGYDKKKYGFFITSKDKDIEQEKPWFFYEVQGISSPRSNLLDGKMGKIDV